MKTLLCNLITIFALCTLCAPSALAQCPPGWTAASTTITMCDPPQPVTVYYCYRNNYADPVWPFAHCAIQITEVCNSCPGVSNDDMLDLVINAIAGTANPLGLSAPLCPSVYTWSVTKPLCTEKDGTCVRSCGQYVRCSRFYSVCHDGYNGLVITNFQNKFDTDTCDSSCQTGSCP